MCMNPNNPLVGPHTHPISSVGTCTCMNIFAHQCTCLYMFVLEWDGSHCLLVSGQILVCPNSTFCLVGCGCVNWLWFTVECT